MTMTSPNLLPRKSSRGFTLVEILVVVAIIALLLAISVTAIRSSQKNTEVSNTRATIVALESAVADFQTERNIVPQITANAAGVGANDTSNILTTNAYNFVSMLVFTDRGRATLATLEKAGAVTVNRSGGIITGVSSGPLDAWGQPIRMSGDATTSNQGTTRWFWSIGPISASQTDDSSGTSPPGNPVQKDDIGGNNNTRK